MSQKVILETTSTKPKSYSNLFFLRYAFESKISARFIPKHIRVCVQVGVEPPLGKLFNIEFTKYQVQRKNQNIFELFMFDTPLT